MFKLQMLKPNSFMRPAQADKLDPKEQAKMHPTEQV
jgi:hypothetical protein